MVNHVLPSNTLLKKGLKFVSIDKSLQKKKKSYSPKVPKRHPRAGGHGRDKSSEPMGTFLTQEVHFQNIEHMANGCKQTGFHSFIFTKPSITVDLPQIFRLICTKTTLDIFFPIRGLFVGMFIQNQPPILVLTYSILNILQMMLERCWAIQLLFRTVWNDAMSDARMMLANSKCQQLKHPAIH